MTVGDVVQAGQRQDGRENGGVGVWDLGSVLTIQQCFLQEFRRDTLCLCL